MPPSTDLLQGTLDLLILKTLALEPMHGWGIALRIQQVSNDSLAGRSGFALPRTAPPGVQGVDQVRVGNLRKQPAGKILPADLRRPKAIED